MKNVVSKKVLVIDDDDDCLVIMDLLLKRLNCEVTLVENGGEAINACENTPPDLIILDMNIPNTNSIELVTILKESIEKKQKKSVPILAISGSSESFHLSEIKDHVFQGYLQKPVSLSDLKSVLEVCFS